MKSVLMAIAACLMATTAFGFQADQPRQQQRLQYNQQLERKPNEKSTNVDGWLVSSWNDEFSDKLTVAAARSGSKGGIGFRCWAGESMGLLLAAPVKQGDEYEVEFRFDQNPVFVSTALAVGNNTLEIIAGGSEHAMERFLTEFANAKLIRYRTTINSVEASFKAELGGNNTNIIKQVMWACKDMPTDDRTSQNKRDGKDP